MEFKRTNVEKTKQVIQNNSSRPLSSIIGNRVYSDLYLPPIIQREKPKKSVKPIESKEPQTNYYIQPEKREERKGRKRKREDEIQKGRKRRKLGGKTDEVEKGEIRKVAVEKYKKSQRPEDRKSDEPGYLSFSSTQKASEYSKTFLSQLKNKEEWVYKKNNIDIKLPISCIEAATWAMKIMGSSKVEKYPGYMEFPSEFYNAIDVIEKKPGKLKIQKDKKIEALLKEYKITLKDYNFFVNEFNKRFTDVKIYGAKGSWLSTDRDIISNKFVGSTDEYKGNYNVGDGILIAKRPSNDDDEAAEFHAVAIVAVFENKGFIVLERNAGSTEIQEGHLGDKHWVLNYYESADDFKDKTQKEPKNYKAFLLRI